MSFSILMANYNNASYIEEAIKSVISQTYSNWELIVVDDCSTDDSIRKILPFTKDKRINIIQNKKNVGYGCTLKTAADHALNDIFVILDADDKLHEDALKIILNTYQENPECGFVYSTMWECDSQLQNCIRNSWIGPDFPPKSNIFRTKISHLKTFRREAYLKTSGFDPNQKKAVDKDIIFKLEEVTYFKFINTPLYYYRWHGKGISQSKSSFSPEYYHYLAKLKAYKRRLSTNTPNFTKKQIYFEYYRITFYKLFHFFLRLYSKLNIRQIVNKLIKKLKFIPEPIKNRLLFLKKLN
ncbi:MAG: glycosyltransferase family 2 protein [Candidatus Thorarchaeota archaeon]